MTKWIVALKAAAKVYKALRAHQKQERIAKRTWQYEHEADVLYAKLIATAAGDPEPIGN